MAPARPLDSDPVIDPLLTRAKALGLVLPRKPASVKQDPAGFVRAQVTAKAFDTVLTARRIANTTVADMWGGVSESLVRGVRSGDKPLTLSKVQQLPADLREAIDAKTEELLADLRDLRASLPTLSDDLRSVLPSNDHHVRR